MDSSGKFNGVVIWFNPSRGYGFIKREGEEDLFVHFSDIVCDGFKTLKKGQVVEYGLGTNNKGDPKAIEVEVIGDQN